MVHQAIERARLIIFTEGLVPWKLHERNAEFEPPLNSSQTYIKSVDVHLSDDTSSRDVLDESYSLRLMEQGRVEIHSKTSIGLIRALDTFTQLFYRHSESGQDVVYTNLAPLQIDDRPRFQHRGLNLDVARNWYPVADILRTIDALAWNKFNRLHLHITDAQSWPLEIPALPKLARQGAYRKDLTYSSDDLKHMQSYAALRGIELYLEVDMPGHTASIAHAYPNLIAATDMQPQWELYSLEPPSGQLKLNSSAVRDMIAVLLDDLLPRLRKHGSTMFHTGGDELNLNVYRSDETVHSNNRAVIRPLLQAFVDAVHDRVRKHGLIPVVWEEMLLDWELSLGKDVIIQTWRDDVSVVKVARRGHRVLAGNYHSWYLDCGHGSWLIPRSRSPSFRDNSSSSISGIDETISAENDNNNNNNITTRYLFSDYCSPYKPWQFIYDYNPVIDLPSHLHHLLFGAEAHLWSELTDPVNLDGKLWPRLAAVAEVLWTGPGPGRTYRNSDHDDVNNDEMMNKGKRRGGENRYHEVARRLAQWRERLVLRGIRAEVVQMVWCTQMGPSSCTF